jgi:hypothetical protein
MATTTAIPLNLSPPAGPQSRGRGHSLRRLLRFFAHHEPRERHALLARAAAPPQSRAVDAGIPGVRVAVRRDASSTPLPSAPLCRRHGRPMARASHSRATTRSSSCRPTVVRRAASLRAPRCTRRAGRRTVSGSRTSRAISGSCSGPRTSRTSRSVRSGSCTCATVARTISRPGSGSMPAPSGARTLTLVRVRPAG